MRTPTAAVFGLTLWLSAQPYQPAAAQETDAAPSFDLAALFDPGMLVLDLNGLVERAGNDYRLRWLPRYSGKTPHRR